MWESIQAFGDGDLIRHPETNPRFYRNLGRFAARKHNARHTGRGSRSNTDGRTLAAARRRSYRSAQHGAHAHFGCITPGGTSCVFLIRISPDLDMLAIRGG
jgi:hypothetical protein